jgi:hypothetical protein
MMMMTPAHHSLSSRALNVRERKTLNKGRHFKKRRKKKRRNRKKE